MTENYIEEHNFICNSDAKNKKEYKEECLEYKQELENDFWHDYAQRKAYWQKKWEQAGETDCYCESVANSMGSCVNC